MDPTPMQRLEIIFGIGAGLQQRIGAAAVLWSIVERNLELMLWAAEGETFPQGRPTTDAVQPTDLIKRLAKAADALPDRQLAAFVSRVAGMARHLLDIRNTIMHGLPKGMVDGRPILGRNSSILGEQRRRETTALVIDEAVMDEVLRAYEAVSMVLGRAGGAVTNPTLYPIEVLHALERALAEAEQTAARLAADMRRT